MPRPSLPALLLSLVAGTTATGQREPTPETARTAARTAAALAASQAIHKWVEGFAGGRITPMGEVHLSRSNGEEYVRIAVTGGALVPGARPQKTTHFSLLHRLVGVAEQQVSREVAEAFLALSAAGYSRDLYSPATIQVREVGHYALRRNTTPTIWDHILGVATGRIDDSLVPGFDAGEEPAGEADDDHRDELQATARVMRRVAAVRLLGLGANPVFRVALEKCLADGDPRIRLAAAESFEQLRDLRYLYTLSRQAAAEPHPLVVMALLSAVERTLARHRKDVPIGRGMNALRILLPLLGQRGWRNDMTIVRLVRDYPVKPAIPALISALRAAQARIDPLLEAVNEDASPVLADEIHRALRQATGALLPADPNRWQEFWNEEQDRLQLVAPYRRRRPVSGATKGTFFGIPVVGREVVFVIDTSGSMKKSVIGGTATRRNGGEEAEAVTRLDAARQQTLNAVQGIPESTRFHLVTFSGEVRVWNQKPVKAGPEAYRTLTESLRRVTAQGGTNVYAALRHVLGAAQIRYGQEIKRGVEEVFLLSDGEPSVGAVKDPGALLAMVRELNRYQKIRINTVFAGVGEGADFMAELAAQNHGVFVRR